MNNWQARVITSITILVALLALPSWVAAEEITFADGNTYDVRASGVYEDDAANAYVGLSIFWDLELRDEASLVYAADHLFELAVMSQAQGAGIELAVVQIYDRAPSDRPTRLIEAHYGKTSFNQWIRLNLEDYLIAPSEIFPAEPVQTVGLPSGLRVALEPVATIFPGTDRERTVVHMVSPDVPEDFSNSALVMAEMWDVALRTNPYFDDVTDVTLVVYRNPQRNRFHLRTGFSINLNRHPLYAWDTFVAQLEQTRALLGDE